MSDSDRRLLRWVLQAAARELMPRERVSGCLRRVGFDPKSKLGYRSIDVMYSACVHRAHYKNLMVCASVWMCPICAAKITERRRVELSEAILRNPGLVPVLITLTLQHNYNDRLALSLECLNEAYRFLKSGRWWKQFVDVFSWVGSIRSVEVTYGENGWHPHFHVLAFLRQGVSVDAFERVLKNRWVAVLDHVGASATVEHGCDVRTADNDVADYVLKYGREPFWKAQGFEVSGWDIEHELAKSPSKVSRSIGGATPLQLLADYALLDDQDVQARASNLWRDYARVFKGKRQLVWSRGLRSILGMVKEESDEEIVERVEEPAFLLARLSLRDWYKVKANDCRGELLDVASLGDREELNRFLLSIGIDRGGE